VIKLLGDVDLTKDHKSIAADIVNRFFPGCAISGIGVWEMEPGQVHPAHWDEQPPYWITRIHVPLITNPKVVFTSDEGDFRMKVGKAYSFNTKAMHAVANHGKTTRVHLVFDIRKDDA
jgi:hypothetical protein